ncbi:MAG: hypothetical protein LUE17_17995 [Planctomycetaceae bacterium]|nr:hypothetical protein [Planctomycetaceae bacterium]
MRAVFLAVVVTAASALSARGGEVIARNAPPDWNTRLGSPVFLDVLDGTGDLALTIRGVGVETRDRFALSGLPLETVESTIFSRSSVRLEWNLAGRTESKYVSVESSPDSHTFLCINGAMYRELMGEASSHSGREVLTYPGVMLPGLWQSYAGLSAVLVVDVRDARAFSRDQREALRHWLLWSAGILWVVGDDGDAVLREWGWRLDATGDRNVFSIGAGTVRLADASDAAVILATPYSREKDLLDRFVTRNFHDPERRLTQNFRGASTLYIIVCLVVLGLVLGPVNYWVAKRLRSMLFFFVLTPLAAILGSAAIVGGTLVTEGGGVVNEKSILFGTGEDALLVNYYGVRPGVLIPQLRFPAETLLVAENYMSENALVMERTGGVVVREGLLLPRLPSVFGTARPVKNRMAVTLGDNLTVENTLGFDLHWVVATDGVGWARDIPAGATVTLEQTRIPDDIEQELRLVPNTNRFGGRRAVIAKAAGLPYLDDGGLGPRRFSAEYYFVGLGEREDGE